MESSIQTTSVPFVVMSTLTMVNITTLSANVSNLPRIPCIPLRMGNETMPHLTDELITKLRSYCKAGEIVVNVLVSVSAILGLPGNSIAFLVTRTLKKSAFTFLLMTLSAGDFISLVGKLVLFLDDHFHFLTMDQFYINIILKIPHFISVFPNWILVLLCLERFVSIKYPLHKEMYFSHKKAVMMSVATASLVIFMFTVSVILLSTGHKSHSIVDSFCYSFLPVALVMVCTIGIGLELRRHRINREGLGIVQDQKRARTERSITIMMFVAAVCFLVLTLPFCLVLPLYRYYLEKTLERRLKGYIMFCVTYGFSFLSHASNCLLYFVSTKQFRDQFFKLIRYQRSGVRKSLKSSTQTTSI